MAHLGTHSQMQIIQKKAENMKKKNMIIQVAAVALVIFAAGLIPFFFLLDDSWNMDGSPIMSWTPILVACGLLFILMFFVAPTKEKRRKT